LSVIASFGYWGWLAAFCALQGYTLLYVIWQTMVGRWFGIPVKVISIGLGPRLLGFRLPHTPAWQLCAIPLGGFTKFGDEILQASPTARILTALAGPLTSLIAGYAVLHFSARSETPYAPLLAICGQIGLLNGAWNLLPIPILNGGTIVIVVIEALRGRPFAIETKERLFRWALALLLVLIPTGLWWLIRHT